MLVYEIQSLLIDLAHDLDMAFICKNGAIGIPYSYSDEDIIFKGKPYCSIVGIPFTELNFCPNKGCYSQQIIINTDNPDKEGFLFYFSSCANGIWFSNYTGKIHGARLILILESFMKKLGVSESIYDKYSKEFRRVIKLYGYSLTSSIIKKAEEDIIENNLRREWDNICEYHYRNDDNGFRDSESAYKLFCVQRRPYLYI